MLKFIKDLFMGKTELPFPSIDHPQLGTIHFIEDGWFADRTIDGYELDLEIPGTEHGPDPQLAQDVDFVINNFSLLWHEGKQLINSYASKFGYNSASQFNPDAIADFARQNGFSSFTMYLSLDGDEEGVWKLKFHNEKAVSLSRDN